MVEASKKIYDFKVRADDIWILTFPKCGTTWTQELVWQIVNFDLEKSRKVSLHDRSPFLEREGLADQETLQSKADSKGLSLDDEQMKKTIETWTKSIEITENMPSPRIIKTHLPFEMLPPNLLDTCKVICMSESKRCLCVLL